MEPLRNTSAARRDRAILRTFSTGGVAQVSNVAGTLVTLPFVTRSLTSAEYGVLVTLMGLTAIFSFADLGAGAALTQRVSAALAANDPLQARRSVSAAVVTMALTTVTLGAVGTVAALTVPWQRVLGAPGVDSHDMTASVAIAAWCMGIAVWGSIGQRVLFGLQRGATANMWLTAGLMSGMLGSIAAAAVSAPLAVFVLAGVGLPGLVSAGCTVSTLTSLRGPDLRPRLHEANRKELRRFAGTSGWFLIIGIAGAIGYQTDTLVVATCIGASAAGVYSVAFRMFALISQCVYPALLQGWPSFTEALHAGDYEWVRSRFRIMVLAALAVSLVAGTAVVLAGNRVIAIWLKPELQAPESLLIALAAWTSYSLASAPMFFLMNAVSRVRTHAMLAAGVTIANLPLSVLLAQRVGLAGPAVASLLSNVVIQGIPGAILVRGIFRELRSSSGLARVDGRCFADTTAQNEGTST